MIVEIIWILNQNYVKVMWKRTKEIYQREVSQTQIYYLNLISLPKLINYVTFIQTHVIFTVSLFTITQFFIFRH